MTEPITERRLAEIRGIWAGSEHADDLLAEIDRLRTALDDKVRAVYELGVMRDEAEAALERVIHKYVEDFPLEEHEIRAVAAG